VSPVSAAPPDEPVPVLTLAPSNGEGDATLPRSRRPDDQGPGRRQAPSRREGWGGGTVLLILAGALVLVGGVGTLAFLVRRGGLGGAGNPAIPASDWQDFRPAGGRCSVSTPGVPAEVAFRYPATINAMGKKFDLQRDNRTFSVAYIDCRPGSAM